MNPLPLKIVMVGLSITSSWGNGHATTYRGLVRELAERGHDVLFLERDVPWYAANRDLPAAPHARIELYASLQDFKTRFRSSVAEADFVMVGSYVPEGVAVGEWVTSVAHGVTAFYDIDTPVTIAKLQSEDYEYIAPALIPRYHLYLSFTGGSMLSHIERRYGAPLARPLYCSVDPSLYYPEDSSLQWDLGYLGTYSNDRQSALDELMLEPARQWKPGRFIVAGPLYPDDIAWPANVERVEHIAPEAHRTFYNAQRFTLNVTRAPMVRAGFSPSVRLFEAGACGTPIISDPWEGLETVFKPGKEVLVARNAAEVLQYLREISEEERAAIGARARARVLEAHTAAHRAEELEGYILKLLSRSPPGRAPRPCGQSITANGGE